MRILYHHRTQAEDAQGIHIVEMVRAFQNLGHEVKIVALVKPNGISPGGTRKYLSKYLLRLIPKWLYEILGFAYNIYGYWSLGHAIKAKRPNLIYERYALNTFCGIWAAKRFGIPLVLEVNAPLWYEQSKLGRLRFERLARFSERWICSHASWTVVVSNVMKNLLIREGVPDERLIVMPNGIDPHRFHPNVCGQFIRRRYGLDDKQVIGFVGWFRRWHGLEMLLQLMHEANLAERNVRLLLVGDGPAYSELRRYAEEQNLLPAVIFTGPVKQEEVPAHIAAMDIAVQPKATEYACPMKLFEYMAMRKCVVAPDQPNIREIIQDKSTGCLFEPGNKKSLRMALSQMLTNPERRNAISHNASKYIVDHGFLWRTNAERVISLVSCNSAGPEVQFRSERKSPE